MRIILRVAPFLVSENRQKMKKTYKICIKMAALMKFMTIAFL
jgi:hypothetical protein